MNCKQGDLAIIVESMAGNEGKIVRCVEFFGTATYRIRREVPNNWLIEPKIPGLGGEMCRMVDDASLRPIRDQDGEDEMLRIAGKPMGITA